jgi:hypothetical protein
VVYWHESRGRANRCRQCNLTILIKKVLFAYYYYHPFPLSHQLCKYIYIYMCMCLMTRAFITRTIYIYIRYAILKYIYSGKSLRDYITTFRFASTGFMISHSILNFLLTLPSSLLYTVAVDFHCGKSRHTEKFLIYLGRGDVHCNTLLQ